MPRNLSSDDEVVDPVQQFLQEQQPVSDETQDGLTCPDGHSNSPKAKFCQECGHSFAGVAPVAGAGLAVERAAQVQPGRPTPEGLLTPQQRAERDRQHREAVKAGSADPPIRYQPPQTAETVLIHFLEDGFSAFGVVWMRGQEIELDVEGPRWEEAKRWITLDPSGQMQRYGKIFYNQGPWPGLGYEAAANDFQKLGSLTGAGQVTGPAADSLTKAAEMERRRKRGVPAPSAF